MTTITKNSGGVDAYGSNGVTIKSGVNKISQSDYNSIRGFKSFRDKVQSGAYHVLIEKDRASPVEEKKEDSLDTKKKGRKEK